MASNLTCGRAARRLTWLCAAAIAALSLAPIAAPGGAGADKIGHFIAYATLAALAALGWRGRVGALWLALAVIAYGAVIEAAQDYVPGRVSDWRDGLANAAGAVFGLAAMAAAAAAAARVRAGRRNP